MINNKKGTKSTTDTIVFLGESTFPVGLGAIQRMTLMAKSLLFDQFNVIVICRKGGVRKNHKITLETSGTFEGIDYVYTSGNVVRPDGFLERNLSKIKGMIGEYRVLSNLKKTNNLRAAIISNHSAYHLLRYRIYSLIIGFPIILNFVEMASSMKGRESFGTRLNDYIFDNFIIKIVDGALPISDVLMNYYKKISPSKPLMKLPILCDFKKFDLQITSKDEVVFLYCGAASYIELIEFILGAFDKLEKLNNSTILKLVLGGSTNELRKVGQLIEKAIHRKNIRLVVNLPHKSIPVEYCNACALLIPLRPTLQDAARFPHKIGEYLASGRPMITTRYGEIKNYDFVDEVNVLIADEYDEMAFAERMNYVIENPIKSIEIGKQGKQLGLNNFDYSRYGSRLRGFISTFNQKVK